MKTKKIILASGSPRRKQILEQVGLKFTIEVSDYEEKPISGVKPYEFVETLSLEKAKAVAKNHNDAIIIAADTIVFLNNQILGKPKTKEDARGMLKKLSGNTHSVFTGFTIIDTVNKRTITNHVETKIRFKNLSEEEILAYIETKEPMDKAGSYGVQDRGALFVEHIEGDYSSVMGLPILKIFEILKEFGIDILKTYEK